MDTSDAIMTSRFLKPSMIFYEDRLHTFEFWSKQIRPTKEALSKAGFNYTGNADKVTCFACGVHLSSWDPTDEPWAEHEKWSPSCIYVKMTGYKPEPKTTGFTFDKQQPQRQGFSFGQNSAFGSYTGSNLFAKRP